MGGAGGGKSLMEKSLTEGKGARGAACGTGEGGTEGGGEIVMIVGPGIVGSGGGGELAMIVDGPVGVRGSRLLASNTLYYSGV
jgi:hypothetical protein